MNTISCPGCGHLHPNGIGISMCGCSDCHLLSMDPAVLGDEARRRLTELRAMARHESEDKG